MHGCIGAVGSSLPKLLALKALSDAGESLPLPPRQIAAFDVAHYTWARNRKFELL